MSNPIRTLRYSPHTTFPLGSGAHFTPLAIYRPPSSLASDDDLINSAQVEDSINETFKSSANVQNYITVAITQRDIDLDKIKSMKKTQQESREHARWWLNTGVPKVNNTYVSVSSFCNLSDAYWDDLTRLLKGIEKPDDDNAKQFKWGLQDLMEESTSKKNQTNEVIQVLQTFRDDLEGDVKNYDIIIADADRIYKANEGVISTLRKTVKACEDAIQRDIGIISGGALGVVGGIIMIAVGAIGSVVTGGAAVKLVVAGVITTIGGVAAITAAALDLERQQKLLAESIQELARLEAELAALETVTAQFSSLHTQGNDAFKALENMRGAWISIYNNFQAVIDAINTVNPDKLFFLINRFNAVRNTFNTLKEVAVQAQLKGLLDVKVEASLAESLGLSGKVFYSLPFYDHLVLRHRGQKKDPVIPLQEVACYL